MRKPEDQRQRDRHGQQERQGRGPNGRGTSPAGGNTGAKKIRCAIYTRKSSEEGLEQDFNSLHAQREACESYIASQRHEGWKVLSTTYDDGGYSGGSMERPGLQKLLADIQSGLIDIVVVYKVDRLTRSLTDFARIVESFDARGASFVSVTQAFNTTTSMGRLTLNVLLSFAQFEREVTGERIRDKIAASKKKGLWMGGFVPMGYKAAGRTLEIVEDEAAIIRTIFKRFLELESVKELKAELDAKKITTRAFTSATNRSWGNRPFSIGHLRSILKNPIYVGEVSHRGERHPGQHQAIVDQKTFDEVQQLIAGRAHHHRLRLGADHPNLLAGLVEDDQGNSLMASHASKKGRRYRYYISRPEAETTIRIPAGDLEQIVIDAVSEKLCDRRWLHEHLIDPEASPQDIAATMKEIAAKAPSLASSETEAQRSSIQSLLRSVAIGSDSISIELRATDAEVGDRGSTLRATIEVDNPFVLQRQDAHSVLRADEPKRAMSNKALVKAIARAAAWYDDLVSGRAPSAREIAEQEKLDERYVSQLLRLAFINPAIVTETLDGDSAIDIAAEDIARGLDLPMLWSEQRSRL